jgi:dienelactone hydrolase
MLSPAVKGYLEHLGRGHTGRGDVVECGCCLGGGTAYLARGLAAGGYRGSIWCYDRWKADAREVEKARRASVALSVGQNLEPLFRAIRW